MVDIRKHRNQEAAAALTPCAEAHLTISLRTVPSA